VIWILSLSMRDGKRMVLGIETFFLRLGFGIFALR